MQHGRTFPNVNGQQNRMAIKARGQRVRTNSLSIAFIFSNRFWWECACGEAFWGVVNIATLLPQINIL